MHVLRIAALVSTGRHSLTDRTRRADLDARAIELALRTPAADLWVIHAGPPNQAALRGYMGMGLGFITVLDIPGEEDPYEPLIEHLAQIRPDLVLTGARGESGEASGYLPYRIAEGLHCPIVANIAAIERRDHSFCLWQGLPRGRRRHLEVTAAPLVATVGDSAPAARQSAFARARRGELKILEGSRYSKLDAAPWKLQTFRPRPKRLSSFGFRDPFHSSQVENKHGPQMLEGMSADMIAERLLKYLRAEELLPPAEDASRQ